MNKTAVRRKQKTTPKPRAFLKLALVLAAIAICVTSVISALNLRSKQEKRVRELRKKVLSLEETNQKLKDEIAYRQSLEYVEKEAREKLKMTRDGEEIIIVPTSEDDETEVPERERKENWWNKIWTKLNNLF